MQLIYSFVKPYCSNIFAVTRSSSADIFPFSPHDQEMTTNPSNLIHNEFPPNPHQPLPPAYHHAVPAHAFRHSTHCAPTAPQQAPGLRNESSSDVFYNPRESHPSRDESKLHVHDQLAKTRSLDNNSTLERKTTDAAATHPPLHAYSSSCSSPGGGAAPESDRASSETIGFLLRRLSLLESCMGQMQIERAAREKRLSELERQNARLSAQVAATAPVSATACSRETN